MASAITPGVGIQVIGHGIDLENSGILRVQTGPVYWAIVYNHHKQHARVSPIVVEFTIFLGDRRESLWRNRRSRHCLA